MRRMCPAADNHAAQFRCPVKGTLKTHVDDQGGLKPALRGFPAFTSILALPNRRRKTER